MWIWTGGEMGRIWRSLGRRTVIRVDRMEKTIFDRRKVDKMKIPTGPSIEAFWEPTRLWFISAVSCLLVLGAQVLILGRFPHRKTWIIDYPCQFNIISLNEMMSKSYMVKLRISKIISKQELFFWDRKSRGLGGRPWMEEEPETQGRERTNEKLLWNSLCTL